MMWIFCVLLFYSLIYSIFLLLLRIGLKRLKEGNNNQYYSVSVIIAARNEEKNIVRFLNSMKNIDYPSDRWELIVVDDRSEDSTFRLAESFKPEIPNLNIIRIEKKDINISPKKNALEAAIRNSNGEIILTTDADCRPKKEWISEIVSHFDKETAMVAGFSPLIDNENKDNLLSSFQFIESISLGGLSASAIGLGFPLTCSGRNLAYKREIFNNIGGFGRFKTYISGDDDLLMHLIRKKTKLKIKYAQKSIVPSIPAENFKDFINNRLRHASKFIPYPLDVKIISAFFYLFNLTIILSFLCIFLMPIYLWIFIISLLIKYFSDYSFIKKAKKKFGIKEPTQKFTVVFLLHPFYITIFGLLGLRGKFKWKNKIYKAKNRCQ